MDTKTITLTALQDRIEKLEKEMAGIKKSANAPKPEKKAAPAGKVTEQIVGLLASLTEAREKDDAKAASGIRRQLRAAGYSLRDANGKK